MEMDETKRHRQADLDANLLSPNTGANDICPICTDRA
jgi:hypothetical protein